MMSKAPHHDAWTGEGKDPVRSWAAHPGAWRPHGRRFFVSGLFMGLAIGIPLGGMLAR